MKHIIPRRWLQPLRSIVFLVGLLGGPFIAGSAALSFANETTGNLEFGSSPRVLAQVAAAFAVSGNVSSDQKPLVGVTITFERVTGTGAVPGEAVTDEQGRWNQAGFERGTVYRITPSRLEVDTFNPKSIDNLSNPSPNALLQAINQNFQITIPKFRVSGRVGTRTRGTGIANLTIAFSRRSGAGPVPASVTTNKRGELSQQGFEMGTAYAATPTGPFLFSPTSVPFLSTESPDLRDRDFTVPDTFAIGGRLTTTDSQILSRRLVVTLAIKAVSGGSQEVFCVKTPLGVPWIREGLDTTKTYEVTPDPRLEVTPNAFDGKFYLFGPPSVRVQGPRTDLNFNVSSDRLTVERFGGSPCR